VATNFFFFTVSLNVCWSSVWDLLYVTLLGPEFEWVLDFPDVFIRGLQTRIAGRSAVLYCELGRRLRCDGRMMFSESLHGAVFLEKLTGSHLLKKFIEFYGNRRFITAVTGYRHLSLS
jgi:hypothetical protein